jgi:hypothetical protein
VGLLAPDPSVSRLLDLRVAPRASGEVSVKNTVQMMRSWNGVYHVPRIGIEELRDVARFAGSCVLLLSVLYCCTVGWAVVQDLREVKLIELRQVFRTVSIGDALLTWFGYVLVRDVVRGLIERRH